MSAPAPEPLKLAIRATPNASKSEIIGPTDDGVLKVKLNAPPEDGKANKELIRLMAKELGLRKSQVSINSGDKSRNKILILTPDAVQEEALAVKLLEIQMS